MEFLKSEAEVIKQIRLKKETAKEKRARASRQPLREVLTFEDFKHVLSLCSSDRYTSHRKTLAFAILYLTGLRVSNLLILSVKNMTSLFKDGHMEAPLTKGGSKRHYTELSEMGVSCLI